MTLEQYLNCILSGLQKKATVKVYKQADSSSFVVAANFANNTIFGMLITGEGQYGNLKLILFVFFMRVLPSYNTCIMCGLCQHDWIAGQTSQNQSLDA